MATNTIVRIPCEDGAEYDLFFSTSTMTSDDAVTFIDSVLEQSWWEDELANDYMAWLNSKLEPAGFTQIDIPTTNNVY